MFCTPYKKNMIKP